VVWRSFERQTLCTQYQDDQSRYYVPKTTVFGR
jgi:hypothetical protein